jgi:hypothetical protein
MQLIVEVSPTVQVGLSRAAPPDFILKAERPIGVAGGQTDQSVT